ncbi:hypothetical protein SASC598O02_015360 [Snodgrassella alvi SCGC AB-598-O02]|nr:hypothetical protein SASC598O02_015360 [Snodgrassella alvi SCGC AB-598-O02]
MSKLLSRLINDLAAVKKEDLTHRCRLNILKYDNE